MPFKGKSGPGWYERLLHDFTVASCKQASAFTFGPVVSDCSPSRGFHLVLVLASSLCLSTRSSHDPNQPLSSVRKTKHRSTHRLKQRLGHSIPLLRRIRVAPKQHAASIRVQAGRQSKRAPPDSLYSTALRRDREGETRSLARLTRSSCSDCRSTLSLRISFMVDRGPWTLAIANHPLLKYFRATLPDS